MSAVIVDVPGQRVLDAEVPAVLRRDLEVRVDRIDRAVVALRRVEIEHVLRDVEAIAAVKRADQLLGSCRG